MVRPRRTVTLPSVESWGTNMNIVKDPPKSVFTRRINKVGSDNKLLNTLADSGNRWGECVQIYPRGVNPMVGVSYNNTGITNGQNATLIGQNQASLPYKAFDNGAFRPPALEGLTTMLPLSRMNRLVTNSLTNRKNVQTVLKTTGCHTKKTVHQKILKSNIRPTATYNIHSRPIRENYEVNYVITNPVKVTALTNIKGDKQISHHAFSTEKYIKDDYSPVITYTNPQSKSYIKNKNMETKTFIQDTLKGAFNSNKRQLSNTKQNKELENKGKNIPNYSYIVNQGTMSNTKNNTNTNVVLDKEILNANVRVNKAQTRGVDFLSRDAYLHPKIEVKGRHNLGKNVPLSYHKNLEVKLDTNKVKLMSHSFNKNL
jgi:hypothetical protein